MSRVTPSPRGRGGKAARIAKGGRNRGGGKTQRAQHERDRIARRKDERRG